MLKATFLLLLTAVAVLACHSADSSAPGRPVDPTAPVDPGNPVDPVLPEIAEIDEPDLLSSDLIVEPARVEVETYDGSGELVHPDALVFPHSWNGHRYWFAATPYPLGNSSLENPSAFAGDSAQDWSTIPGLANPVAKPTTDGYLSDPDLSYDAAHNRVRLYYRQTTNTADQVFLRTSTTGSEWSTPTLVVEDARYSLISPAIVRESDGTWRMWTVNAVNGGCRAHASALSLAQRRSRDGIKWNGPEPVSLTIPKFVPWHWDVQYIKDRQEYWALVAAYPDLSNCSMTSVFFARSVDGTNWTVSPTPLLAPGALPALKDLVYRSTFRYYPSGKVVRVWFSGASVENERYHYAVAIARYPLEELLRRVNQAGPTLSVSAMREREPDDAAVQAARDRFISAFP